jgi:hypothetical protein
MRMTTTLGLAFAAALVSTPVRAANLPDHDPISVLIVGDAVNPHGLPPHLLTEPADLGEAIARPGSGIRLAMLTEVDSACIDQAIDLLETGGVDVMIYFAHRSATACDGVDRQADFKHATELLLMDGGGVVVFHHGLHTDDGKEDILHLLGGRADDLAWEPEVGQDVIATAPDHFIASNAVLYVGERDFSAPQLGVFEGRYPFFNNTPDERYPGLQAIEKPGESRTVLFASDYAGPQILGYDLRRDDWLGHVVFYQPGEYKPNALDDVEGSNFQILANAIYYVATGGNEPPMEDTEDDDTDDVEEDLDTGALDEPDTSHGTTAELPPASLDGDTGTRCNSSGGRMSWALTPLLAALVRRRRSD